MKTKNLLNITGALILLTIINGCEHYPKELGNPDSGYNDTTIIIPNQTTKCSKDTVYFQNTILPILVSNCNGTGCHNANDRAEGIVLNNYTNIMKIVKAGNISNSKLYQYITSNNKTMPPSGKMSQATIDLIKKWIEQGAKNNSCTDGCDTTKFTYTADISKIVTTNCMGCHATGATKIGTYSELKTQVDNSKLWNSINHLAGALPMPTSTNKISTCDIKKIQKWIASGSPNN